MKPKTILSLLLIISLLAGFFLLSGFAFADPNSDKLQQMLDAMGLERGGERMKLYTVREVAAILRKRQAFVRAEIAAGRLAAVKLGTQGTRITEEALREYISKMSMSA